LKYLKHELQNLISGTGSNGSNRIIYSITNILEGGKSPSAKAQESKPLKELEEEKLILFIEQNKLWYNQPVDNELLIGEGAEQTVYYTDDGKQVIKFNGAAFYANWTDYFHNLLLHNFFFPSTAYQLIGFKQMNDELCAVVKQNFITTNTPYQFEVIKEFLGYNGFENNRNFDFINKAIGIILEDLHDENVLFRNKVPYFVDTVFYLTKDFWNT
jgi:hypothetical protein